MRHNLGPESELWAREIESRLKALEAPHPKPDRGVNRPTLRVWHRSFTFEMDFTYASGHNPWTLDKPTLSGVLQIGVPAGAGVMFPAYFDLERGILGPDLYIQYKETFFLEAWTDLIPEPKLLGGPSIPFERLHLQGASQVFLRIGTWGIPLVPPLVMQNTAYLGVAWIA